MRDHEVPRSEATGGEGGRAEGRRNPAREQGDGRTIRGQGRGCAEAQAEEEAEVIDLTDLKAALNVPDGFTAHDDYLTALERAAVGYVQRKTGWYWGPEQEVEVVLSGSGTRDLWLPDHASAVSRVVEWSVYGVDIELPAESYALRLEPGSTHGLRLSRRDGGLWLLGYEYAVTYTRGYAAGEEPADIRQAVTGLVAHWFEHRLPVASDLAAQPAPDHVAAIIAAHRKGQV